jgi:hypothetical protein
MSEEMKKMRAQLEEDEQVASLMRGLRGQNLSDELFASADVKMRLVEVITVNYENLRGPNSSIGKKTLVYARIPLCFHKCPFPISQKIEKENESTTIQFRRKHIQWRKQG